MQRKLRHTGSQGRDTHLLDSNMYSVDLGQVHHLQDCLSPTSSCCRKITVPFREQSSKVVQIIKCTCTVFINNFRNVSTNSLIKVSVCRESYDGYVKHKRNDPMRDPWDSQGNKKNAISISIAFCLDFLVRNENLTSEECKTVGGVVRNITFIYKGLTVT